VQQLAVETEHFRLIAAHSTDTSNTLAHSQMSRHVIIVGGGAAGTLVAIHLTRHTREAMRVTVIEPRPRLGEGVAYSTPDEAHVLNVAASGMSIYADDAEHFVRWAHCTPDEFVLRRRYAEYLRDELARQLDEHPDVSFRHVCLPALAISSVPATVDVVGERLVGDAVVIALGNSAPISPAWLDAVDASRVVRDPWAHGALDRIAERSRVLCIGTGLTFVDVALTLMRRNCRVTATSRHGMLPRAHALARATQATVGTFHAPAETSHANLPPLSSPGQVARWLRQQPDWRAAFAALRPETQRIWRGFGDAGQRQFLRHARRHWDVHRHRMAPEVAAALQHHIADGSIEIHRGDGRELAVSDDFQYIVLCTGPDDNTAVTQPPLASLVARGLASPGPHGMGIDTDGDTGQLISASKSPIPDLYAIGPLRRGTLWESTAIPEIRTEARRLAALLLG
jgi:uncharacterized NAD(P)/FAD-binding protein YdhS